MPPSAKAASTKEKIRKTTSSRNSSFFSSHEIKSFNNKNPILKTIDSSILNQRRKVVRNLFGRNHQTVIDAIFFTLQLLKMRVFLNDIEGAKKVVTRLKSFLKKCIACVREYIKIQSANKDNDRLNDILGKDFSLSKTRSNQGISSTQLKKEIAKRVKDEKRKTVSELHDNILQSLAGIYIGLEFCEKLYEKKRKRIIKEINNIELFVCDLSERCAKFCMKEDFLSRSDFKLMPALKEYVNSLVEITDYDIDLTCKGKEDRLPFPLKINLFYIVREALTNAICHANADRVKIEMRINKDRVILEIVDDGIGFVLQKALYRARRLGKRGLIGMTERVESVNGKLVINTHKGQGSYICVNIPIN